MPRAQLYLGGKRVDDDEPAPLQQLSPVAAHFETYSVPAVSPQLVSSPLLAYPTSLVPQYTHTHTHPAPHPPASPRSDKRLSYTPYHSEPIGGEYSIAPQAVHQMQPVAAQATQEVTLFKQIQEKMGTTWSEHNGLYLTGVDRNSAAERCGVAAHLGQRLTHINSIPVNTVHDILALKGSCADYAHGTQTLILRFVLDDRLPLPPGPGPIPHYQPVAQPLHNPEVPTLFSSPVYGNGIVAEGPPYQSSVPGIPGPATPVTVPSAIPTDIMNDDVLVEKKAGEALGCVLEEMVLKSVAQGSPAWAYGLQQYVGDRLTHINGKMVTVLEDVRVIGTDAKLWLRFQRVQGGGGGGGDAAAAVVETENEAVVGLWDPPSAVSVTPVPVVPVMPPAPVPTPFQDFITALNSRDIMAVVNFFRPTSLLRHFDVLTTSLITLRGANLSTYFSKFFGNLPSSASITIQQESEIDHDVSEGLAIWDAPGPHFGSVSVLMNGASVIRFSASMNLDVSN